MKTITISDECAELLDRVTKQYNAETLRNHAAGELDFIPPERTAAEVLEIVLAKASLNEADEKPYTDAYYKVLNAYDVLKDCEKSGMFGGIDSADIATGKRFIVSAGLALQQAAAKELPPATDQTDDQ